MNASALRTREIVTEVGCPSCGQLLVAQQMCLPVQTETEDVWVTARRYCRRGCLLVGFAVPSQRLPRISRD